MSTSHEQLETSVNGKGSPDSAIASPQLKVLFACAPNNNSFISNSIEAIEGAKPSSYCVSMGKELFWNADQDFDVVNLQWPESMFEGWWKLDNSKVQKLCEQIQVWQSKGAKVCLTRHNVRPHIQRSSKDFLVPIFQQVDGVIHLGNASRLDFQQRYATTNWEKQLHQTVAPHPGYFELPNEIERERARNFLGIPQGKKVVLTFGAIRTRTEASFIKRVVQRVSNASEKVDLILLAPRWFRSQSKISNLLRKFGLYQDRVPVGEQYQVGFDFVPNEQIQMYFNAADVVLVPRCESASLNSGVIPLALTFGRVVVGPTTGVMGEMLRQSANPTFGDLDSAVSAVAKVLREPRSKQEKWNSEFAETQLSLDVVGQRLTEFYELLCRDKRIR